MQHADAPRPPLHVYEVDDLIVDPARARVTRAGVDLPLPRLSFDVLLALVEAAPALVTNEQLMQRVWQGVIVSPETVSQRIKLLRAALGDDPRHPRYVTVVRARGYRLIADVRRREDRGADAPAVPPDLPLAAGASAAPATPPATENPVAPAAVAAPAGSTPAPVHSRARARWIAGIVGVALVLAVGVALWRDRAGTPAPASRVGLVAAERSIAVLPFEALGSRPDDEALAAGVAEAVLHRLAGLAEMTVIARRSSFAIERRGQDAREIGRRLGARFLLEGSLQRDGERLRVTAQLVDAESGVHLWSLQFDRAAHDVFAVEDEIAARVADALRVSLDPDATPAAAPPRSFDAYLDYLQARRLLGSARVADLPAAVEALERSLRADPDFAPAQVALASAELQRAEFEAGPDRGARFDAALRQAESRIARALKLDPGNAEAYLVRARVHAPTDPAAAERDFREGLRLAPSDAAGYEGLASVLYQDPRRRDEALALLDRARRLSPLEPRFDVTKAVFLLYGRSEVDGAVELLQEALRKDPLYLPALSRLGELNFCCRANVVEAARYLEQALKLDPQAEWARRTLVLAYLDAGDEAAARDVVAAAPDRVPVRELPIFVHRGDWSAAAKLAYDGYDDESLTEIYEMQAVAAIRRDARARHRPDDAIELLEEVAGVTWDAQGQPVLARRLDLKSAAVALAGVLIESGQRDRGRRLLDRILADIAFESVELKRGMLWYGRARALSLALRGDDEAALAALQDALAAKVAFEQWYALVEGEPAFARLRDDARFRQLASAYAAWRREQSAGLARLREAGVLPRRPAAVR